MLKYLYMNVSHKEPPYYPDYQCPSNLTQTVMWALWPDVGIKNGINVSKSCPKSSHGIFYLKLLLFNIAQKVTKHLEYFCKQICCQELEKFAQSGHNEFPACLSRSLVELLHAQNSIFDEHFLKKPFLLSLYYGKQNYNTAKFDILITNISIMGGRHSSVVLSAPTILRPWVRIPSTPSPLFQCVLL